MKNVVMTVDGSCIGNPGPGGWAAILRYDDHKLVAHGGSPRTTNNEMELMAVWEGLKRLTQPCAVTVRTDSQLVVGWLSMGWKCKHRHLARLVLAIGGTGHHLSLEKLAGHSGDPDQEECDRLAQLEARSQST